MNSPNELDVRGGAETLVGLHADGGEDGRDVCDSTTSSNEENVVKLVGGGSTTVKSLDRDGDGARGRLAGGGLAGDNSSKLASDAVVDAKDELEVMVSRGGGRIGDVGNREGVALAVEVRATKEIRSPERDVAVQREAR